MPRTFVNQITDEIKLINDNTPEFKEWWIAVTASNCGLYWIEQ